MYKLLILFLFTLQVAHAKKVYVFIDAGADSKSNYKTYYNEVRHGYEVVKSQGKDAHIFAKNGKWTLSDKRSTKLSKLGLTKDGKQPYNQASFGEPMYPPISSPARNLEDLKEGIKNLKLSSNDELVVVVNGHGDKANSNSSPENSTLMLWGNEVTWKDFGDVLSSSSKGKKTKLITNICHGGGVHHLSRSHGNICTSSVVPHFNKSSSGINYEGFFSKGLWDAVKEDSNISFANGVTAGFKTDIANAGLGSLGSLDYIDFVLKKGPYKESNTKEIEEEVLGDVDLLKKYNQTIMSYQRPKKYDATMNITSLTEGDDCVHCSLPSLRNINSKILDLEKFQKSVEGKLVFENLSFLRKGVFSFLRNKDNYLGLIRQIQKEEIQLQDKWREHKKEFNDASKIYKYFYDESGKREKIQKEMKELAEKKKAKLGRPLHDLNMAIMGKKIGDFYKIADQEQIDKFQRMIKCESSSL